MTETYEFWIIISCVILWRLGGWKKKALRRIGIPLVLLVLALKIHDQITIQHYLAVGCSCAIYHLGYGEKAPWWKRILVACGYGAATLFLGRDIWQIIVPVVWLWLYCMSNWKKTATSFGWGLCEMIFGGALGAMWRNLL